MNISQMPRMYNTSALSASLKVLPECILTPFNVILRLFNMYSRVSQHLFPTTSTRALHCVMVGLSNNRDDILLAPFFESIDHCIPATVHQLTCR